MQNESSKNFHFTLPSRSLVVQGERYTLYLATKKNSLFYVLSSPTQLTFYIQPKTISLLQRTKTHIELCTFHKKW